MSNGDCFVVAYRVADRVRWFAQETYVVHGMPINRGPRAGERYWHAWVEVRMDDGWHVLDQSNDNDVDMGRILYYALGGLDESYVHRYTVDEHRDGMIEHGTYGPWVDGWEELAL